MKKNTQTERHDCQIMPFTFGDHAVRTAVIDGSPWFAAKDVCEVLGIANHRNALNGFPADEKGLLSTDAPDGRQYLITVSEPGLYRLIFTAGKKRASGFKNWVFAEMMPQIRRTAAGEANGGKSQMTPEKNNREEEILWAVFDGEISTLKGIVELCGTGLPLEEASHLVYESALAGMNRRRPKKN